MQSLTVKAALTGAVATLLLAIPVSVQVGRSGTTDHALNPIGIGLQIDSAQAIVGRPGTPRSVAGVARRTTRRTVRRRW
jgi:hypothetical protein